MASVYDASDVFDGAVEEIDEEGEGGEEVERRAYADVRQLEAAAVATRRLAGKRTLKALPPVPVAKGTESVFASNASGGASGGGAAGGGAAGRACDVLLPGGGATVGDRLPLNTSADSTPKQCGAASGIEGIVAVSAGRHLGIFETWEEVKASTGGGFRRPRFKRFRARAEAEKWLAAEQAKTTEGRVPAKGASGGAAQREVVAVEGEGQERGKSGLTRGRGEEEEGGNGGPAAVKRERIR